MLTKAFLSQEEIQQKITEEESSDKEQKLTPEQIQAIYSNGNNILVSASAGSGKTFVMVKRILDIISRGVSIDRLFISTFTVKAAAELKERLEKGLLEQLSSSNSDEEKAYLSEQLAKLPTADIGTMDSFTQKLVNQYGYLLGISPIFRIMADSSEQDLLKNEVYDDLFSSYMLGQDALLFKKLVKNFAGKRKDSKNFRSAIYTIYQFSQATANPEEWLKTCFLKGHREILETDERVVQLQSDILTFLDGFRWYFNDHLTSAKQESTLSKAKYLENIELALGELDILNETLSFDNLVNLLDKLVFHSERTKFTNASRPKDEMLIAFKEDYNKEKTAYIEQLRDYQQEVFAYTMAEKYHAEMTPLLEIMQQFASDFSYQYLQAKTQENAFEFNDIAHFAIKILEGFPEVAKLYQEHYHEVMVDEYQDNSHTQERMLELLSNGHNRFMVGDIKQSIYRFRQADPQIFNQKFKTYQADTTKGQLILLKENFRSSSEVIDATNGVFSHLMDEAVGDILYDETHFLVAGSDKQKEVYPEHQTQVLIYEKSEYSSEDEADLSQGEIDLVVKEIIRLHNEEGVSFNEITLLVSSRTRNDELIRTFDSYNIPLVADGGQANYLQSLEIMIMLDTLRAINNPLDDYPLVALLRSPMFQFDEDELARIALQLDRGNFYDKLVVSQAKTGLYPDLINQDFQDKLTIFFKTFQSWRHFAKLNSLYDVIWKIYHDRFYYDYVSALPKAEQRQANLYALALRANQYEKTGFKGLSRFIGMIDKILANDHDLEAVEVAPPKEAVQLMTIHKSKGLEFDYVFVLNCDKRFQQADVTGDLILSRDKGIGIKYLADLKSEFPETDLPKVQVKLESLVYQQNKQESKLAMLSEQMRLLYVAMTRAKKRLYLVGKGQSEKLPKAVSGETKENRLLANNREQMTSFQDWLLSLNEGFKTSDLKFTVTYITDEDLSADKIGELKHTAVIQVNNLSENRQTEQISKALEVLESVDKLNEQYRYAIELPTLRTPSQVKQFYESVLDLEGVQTMDTFKAEKTALGFELPDFSLHERVTGAAIGSATHELMQRLDLSLPIDRQAIQRALDNVQADREVKKQINLDKILTFFDTDLGQEIISNTDRLHREAPFAMLVQDEASKEHFVVRGIVDGYLRYEDRIILFDYKTDRFTDSRVIRDRYQEQMSLYAQALRQSYGIDMIDKYLILLGGEKLEVVKL